MDLLAELSKLSVEELKGFEEIRQLLINKKTLNPKWADSDMKTNRLSTKNIDGTYSAIPNDLRVPSKQASFTPEIIAEKLKNFKEIDADLLFKLPIGTWIRYYNEGGIFCVGGAMIHMDAINRYVTLKCVHHTGTPHAKMFTWNLQVNTAQRIFGQQINVLKYKNHMMDKKFGLRKGTYAFLTKWFKTHDITGTYVVYDTKTGDLIKGMKLSTIMKKLENISKSELETQLQLELDGQILKDRYIITRKIDLEDIKKLRAAKYKISKT
jgi:hypothetical protein